jgi:hypothetical protein
MMTPATITLPCVNPLLIHLVIVDAPATLGASGKPIARTIEPGAVPDSPD